MGHLFYNELGGVTHSLVSATHNANYDLFSNVQPSRYWIGTEYGLDASGIMEAWNAINTRIRPSRHA